MNPYRARPKSPKSPKKRRVAFTAGDGGSPPPPPPDFKRDVYFLAPRFFSTIGFAILTALMAYWAGHC